MIPDQILAWSTLRPDWQRDALRRLFQTSDLDESAFVDLLRMCKEAAGLQDSDQELTRTPLSKEHLGAATSPSAGVILSSISNVQNTNALAPNQTLSFAASGLTVIYGDNGAGKSGYARIMKHACRARGKLPAVLPDVFDASTVVPSADIAFQVGDESASFKWTPSATRPDALGEISVFDTASAVVYVDQRTDVAFRPFGLDVFPKLVQACDKLRLSLQGELANLGTDRSFAELSGEHDVGTAIGAMELQSSDTTIKTLAEISDVEAQRLVDLKRQVAALDVDAPARRAAEGSLKLARLREFRERLETIARSLSTAKLTDIKSIQERVSTTVAAATKARAEAAGFPAEWHVGTAAWQELWKAAKRYSDADLRPGNGYFDPSIEQDCLLCRQPLGSEVVTRMRSLAEFASHEALRAEAEASQQLEKALSELRLLKFVVTEDSTILSEIAATSEAASEATTKFFKEARELRDRILDAVKEEQALPQEQLTADAITQLASLCDSVANEVVELQAASEPEFSAEVRREFSALQARVSLQQLLPEVLAERARRIRRKGIAKAIRTTETAAITTKNTELTKAGISDQLRRRFQSELDGLDLKHLTVSVEPQHGSKGVTYHQVRFANATSTDFNASDVLSEGEQRCIAIAGFLAELSTQPSSSGVVFDDPVSSLDHVRRGFVALRIVAEAKTRQVVLFTHDLVFLLSLADECKVRSVPMETSYLTYSGTKRGVPLAGLPWYGQALTKRIGWLRQQHQLLVSAAKVESGEVVELRASALWGRLQEAWECGVEEVLLGGAVKRFSRSINTTQLRGVSDISAADIAAVDAGMTLCSIWRPGHDLSSAINQPMPSLEVLKAEIEKLETWRVNIVNRRKSAS